MGIRLYRSAASDADHHRQTTMEDGPRMFSGSSPQFYGELKYIYAKYEYKI